MQANGGFRLIVRRGPQPNQVYELTKDVITLGRDITNDIVINDPEASRHHCRLTRTPGGYTLEDLGSTNGTFVNGQRLSAARPLSNGDMVGLGETVTMAYEGAAVPMGLGFDQTVVGAPRPGQAGAPPTGIPPRPQPYAPQPQPYVQPQQPPLEHVGAPPQQDASYEEPASGSSTLRYVLLGCGFLVVLCVVMAVVAVIVIDYGNLWCDIPLGPTIVRLVGGFCP